MRVDELLNKPEPFKYTLKPGKFRARFNVGDTEIVFEAENEDVVDEVEDNGEWTILFGKKVKGKRDLKFDLTGDGNEFAIFATLKTIITEFVEKCDPVIMRFSADSDEPGRARVYQKMFMKNLPKGWKLNRTDGGYLRQTYFDVIKEDANVRDDWLSVEAIKQIWNDANEKVFGGQMSMPKISLEDDLNYLARQFGPDAVEDAKNGVMLGYCDKEGSRIVLRFSKKIKNVKELIEVVVHEMVHQAESLRVGYLNHLKDPHGDDFFAWAPQAMTYHKVDLRQIIGSPK